MQSPQDIRTTPRAVPWPGGRGSSGGPFGGGDVVTVSSAQAQRVLRNTYALLALTLLFSAGVAGVSAAMGWPHPGVLISLVGMFGLLFLTYRTRNSGWGLLSTFAFTGFMGYTLGPILSAHLALPGGSSVVMMAMGGTAITFLGLSAFVLVTKRDFSFMGGFLFVGAMVAFLAGLGAIFFNVPALGLAVSAMFVLISAGFILFDTSRIVHGGETNYILATISLYVSIFNLFLSLLNLLGGSND